MSNFEPQDDNLNPTIEDNTKTPADTTPTATEKEAVDAVEATAEAPAEKTAEVNKYANRTREELVQDLKELLVEPSIDAIKVQVETIKQTFYKARQSEDVQPVDAEDQQERKIDAVEEAFKELLAKYKEKKAAANAILAEQKNKNLQLKQAVLDKLEELTNSTEDLSTTIPAFRKLQQEWRSIEQVPQEAVTRIWKQYNRYQEKFYDLIRINNELREYDFKKNFELKSALCVAAEKLEDEPNAVTAFNTLQKLHEEWREIGPVAKDDREPIWLRFKEASSKINKRHQEHFEGVKAEQEENLKLKTALCEKAEGIDISNVKSRKEWEAKTNEILALQEEWKKIGFATKKANSKIFKRFREACDLFFKSRNAFYKEAKQEMSQNLAKKRDILARAEALKDVENVNQAIEVVKELHKEWKTIGVSPYKVTNEVWNKFSAACDAVFDRRSELSKEQKEEEKNNLNLKREFITKVNELVLSGEKETDIATLKEMMAEFDKIGFVPIKEKRTINLEFRNAIDSKFDEVFGRKSKSRGSNVQLSDSQKKYLKEYEELKKEISSYENNILFLNASSKKGNALVDEMNKKVAELKEKLEKISSNLDK